MPPSSAAGSVSDRKLSVLTRRDGSRPPYTGHAVDLLQPPAEAFDQLIFMGVDVVHALLLHIANARGEAGHAEHVGRAAFEEVRATRFGCVSLEESPPVPPSRHALGVARGPTYSAPVPVGPNSDLWPGNASKSMHMACTSMGTTPAVWAASTRKSRSCSRAMRPTSPTGWTVPRTLLACVRAMRRVCGVIARRKSSGSNVAVGVGLETGQGDAAGHLQGAQRPADAVVFQVGGDDVIAVAEDALEGHVEGVGAVEGEGEAFRPLAVEELVEQVAAVVEGAFGGQGHLVAGAAGVGEVLRAKASRAW